MKYKIIQGKRYNIGNIIFRVKEDALKEARDYRKRGYRARIIPNEGIKGWRIAYYNTYFSNINR